MLRIGLKRPPAKGIVRPEAQDESTDFECALPELGAVLIRRAQRSLQREVHCMSI